MSESTTGRDGRPDASRPAAAPAGRAAAAPTAHNNRHSEAGSAYAAAGVDLDRGYEVVRRIGASVAATNRPGVMGAIGGFGGLFDLKAAGYTDPILVSGTDGVGTKLMLAFETGIHNTVGIDAVAMCVNDVVAGGAEPLFFLDYIAIPTADPDVVEQIVAGIAAGCHESGCALIGGETAEMNDLYEEGTYDIAGFCVAAVERDAMITGDKVRPGDVLIGLPSSGPHSNGFSLLRKIFFKDNDFTVDSRIDGLARPLGEELLEPTALYVRPVLDLAREVDIHGMANITGGGFYENLPRMAAAPVGFAIESGSWPIPPIFDVTQRVGSLTDAEMFNVFNMGIGFVIAVDPTDVVSAQAALNDAGQPSFVIGAVTDGDGVVLS